MWGSPSSSDRRRSLRYVEQYAQDIVTAQPSPPRRFSLWAALRHVAPSTVFAFLASLSVALIVEFALRHIPMQARSGSYYIAIILMPIGLSIVLYSDVLKPIYQWWYGLRAGRYTVARITKIAPRVLRSGNGFEGEWQFIVDHTAYTAPFLVIDFRSGPWVLRLAEGSAVHILVHPTEPHVLAEFGIVDEHSPDLHSDATQQLLTELLGHEPPRESSESS